MTGLNPSELQLKKRWKEINEMLTTRERVLIGMRIGIWDGRQHSLKEVGERFGITKQGVSSIIISTYGRIKNRGSNSPCCNTPEVCGNVAVCGKCENLIN